MEAPDGRSHGLAGRLGGAWASLAGGGGVGEPQSGLLGCGSHCTSRRRLRHPRCLCRATELQFYTSAAAMAMLVPAWVFFMVSPGQCPLCLHGLGAEHAWVQAMGVAGCLRCAPKEKGQEVRARPGPVSEAGSHPQRLIHGCGSFLKFSCEGV